ARAGSKGQQSVHWDFPGGDQGIRFEEDDLGSLFGNLFRGGKSGTFNRKPRPRQGQNLEYPVEVTLEEAYLGASRILNLQSEQACPSCQGSGRIQNAVCSVCRGSGATTGMKQLEVKIPAGVKDGSRVRIAGKGEQGYAGGKNGDLYLKTSVKTHRIFQRKGDDLHSEVAVPLTVAVLGGEVQVPTLKGNLALTIPSETQNGRAFRLTKQGMPQLGKSAYGDLITRVKVVLPTKLSKEEKELFTQLDKLRPDS
ncbi:DnaJ C-terminal domain-containing protein, partial [Chloroflexota bacterium]